jgi:hypothetical protein
MLGQFDVARVRILLNAHCPDLEQGRSDCPLPLVRIYRNAAVS